MLRILRITLLTVAVAVGSLAGAATAAATTPQPVTFQGTTTTPSGSFTATEPLCASGSTLDVRGVAGGFESGTRLEVLVTKQFTCDGTGDTFTLLIRAHITFQPDYSDRFTWTIVGGTGAFERLHGTGSGSAVQTETGGIDTYTGQVHFD